ncbi:MAG: sugar ABC transporter permease [Arcanobacterium sp.]|nr:sugar ABC transporter permease [Arcanobacterium sp.]MDY5589155.1 sugar ABC transporter permease [Arcanobacterium sp.]
MKIMGRKSAKRRKYPDTVMAYALLAPMAILLSIFVIWPALRAIYLSFFNWSFYTDPEFVGLKNFSDVLHDKLFWNSIGLGIKFVFLTVPAQLVIAFLFASFVMSVNRKIASVLKVVIYIPTIISSVITSIVFALIYNYSGGLLNAVVAKFGVPAQAWLGDTHWSLFAIAVPAVWLGIGLSSLIMIAGMVDIPSSFYEAAEIEGANWWQKTIYITLPQLKNVLLYLLVTVTIAAIQQFELPLVMTGGGPLDSTNLPNLFIFNHFRGDAYVGYSLAAALLLGVVISCISGAIFKVVNSEKLVD